MRCIIFLSLLFDRRRQRSPPEWQWMEPLSYEGGSKFHKWNRLKSAWNLYRFLSRYAPPACYDMAWSLVSNGNTQFCHLYLGSCYQLSAISFQLLTRCAPNAPFAYATLRTCPLSTIEHIRLFPRKETKGSACILLSEQPLETLKTAVVESRSGDQIGM
jgi:hypothetical protein